MPERPSEPDASPPHRAAQPDAAAPRDPSARPRCPRCGAPLGALAAGPAAPEALYCGCCGLVLPSA